MKVSEKKNKSYNISYDAYKFSLNKIINAFKYLIIVFHRNNKQKGQQEPEPSHNMEEYKIDELE